MANVLFYQHKRQFYIRNSPNGQCYNRIDYIFSCNRWQNYLLTCKVLLGADCRLDSQHTNQKKKCISLKKTRKGVMPRRYNLEHALKACKIQVRKNQTRIQKTESLRCVGRSYNNCKRSLKAIN